MEQKDKSWNFFCKFRRISTFYDCLSIQVGLNYPKFEIDEGSLAYVNKLINYLKIDNLDCASFDKEFNTGKNF